MTDSKVDGDIELSPLTTIAFGVVLWPLSLSMDAWAIRFVWTRLLAGVLGAAWPYTSIMGAIVVVYLIVPVYRPYPMPPMTVGRLGAGIARTVVLPLVTVGVAWALSVLP